MAKPCVPPSVGSGVITPSFQRKPTQRKPVRVAAGKKKPQLQVSIFGSASAVCEMPVSTPRVFFTGQSTALFGPPSVPRSVSVPLSHSVAWMLWLLLTRERPATHPRLLMLVPRLEVPPSERSTVTT